MDLHLLMISVAICFSGIADGNTLGKDEETYIRLFMEQNQNLLFRPNLYNTSIEINMFIINIGSFDPNSMEFDVTLYLRHKWIDKRFKKGDLKVVTIPKQFEDKIWTPDTFFLEKKEGKSRSETSDETFMRVDFDTGLIKTSTRYQVKSFCSMNMEPYPFDSHSCQVSLESYAYTADYINYIDGGVQPRSNDPSFHSNKFSFVQHYSGKNIFRTATGDYQRVSWTFEVKRNHAFYVVQVVIPSVVLVLLSCISYWLHPMNFISARMILGVGTLLGLMAIQTVGRLDCQAGVVVTHDCWGLACFLFIAISFAELLLVQAFMHFKSPFTKQERNEEQADCSFMTNVNKSLNDSIIDRICRILIPALFVLFSVIFWSVKSTN